MAKKSAVERDKKRRRMAVRYADKRNTLKEIISDKSLPAEERFEAVLALNELPRNSSRTRVRNRCEISGRPRAVYRKFKLSRIALRDLASNGRIPGMVKSSW